MRTAIGSFIALGLMLHSSVHGQTTMDEYNYVTKGYKMQIDGGLDTKRGYFFRDVGEYEVVYSGYARTTSIKLLCREVDSLPCATMVIHKRTNTDFEKFICIPHSQSKVEVWQKAKEDYWAAMYDWDEAAKAFSWNMMRAMAIPAATVRTNPSGFVIEEEMPSFPNGEAALKQYLRESVRYPAEAQSGGISGTVVVNFVVTSTGSIRDARVKNGIGGGCDEEAVRVVNAMPRWNPGKQRGKPVDVQYNLPIRFGPKD